MNKGSCFYLNVFFMTLFLGMALFSLWKYHNMNGIIDMGHTINYRVLGKDEVYGRGMRYEMIVDFASVEYDVDITSEMYYGLDNGVYPELYYNEQADEVFSAWKVKVFFRSVLLFSAFSLGAFVLVVRAVI